MKNNTLPINSAFWRDLGSRFRSIPDASRMQAVLVDTGWYLSGGPGGLRENDYVKELFASLAQSAGYALGTPDGASALNVWLERLRQKSPEFCSVDSIDSLPDTPLQHQGGYIQNVTLASAKYCKLLETGAFADETRDHDRGENDSATKSARAARRKSATAPLLKRKGYRPGTWAKWAGVSTSVVYAYLNGTTRVLSERLRGEMAQALGVNAEDLPE